MADQSHRSGQEKSPSPSRPRERASSAAFPPPAQSSLTPGAAPAPIPGHRDRRHGDGDANQQGAAQLRWASHLISSPPNAAPPIPPSLPVGELTGNPGQTNAGLALDRESATALFSHAALLFHAYCWNMSLKLYRSIIRRSLTFNGNGSDGSDIAAPIPRPLQMAHLWVNVGIIRCHLGEYALAVESFDRAVDHDQHLAVAWFLMGMALFELQDFRRAERRYKMSLSCFDSELNETADDEPPVESKGVKSTTTRIDYRPDGLNFVLERSRVEFNIRLSMLWKLHRQVNAERPPSWSLNRLPAGKVFEPVASSSGGGSRPALRRVKSLLPVEEREVLSRTPEERAAVRFVGTRSTPAAQTSGSTSGPAGKAPASSTSTPTRTPAREETAAPSPAPADADTPSRGKFRPLLREKVLPWLRRLQSHDKETDSTGVGSSSSEPRRFFGKRSASSPQTTTLSAQPENNATSSAANDGGAGRRRRVVDSIALFAPSTHIDSGGDDANAVAQTVPSEAPGTPSATGAGPHSSQFKPLPTLPPLPPLPTLSTLPTFPTLNPTSSSATAPGSATADPGESDRSGTNYPSHSLPSPLVLDPFIAERRHSAFLRLNTARPPGPTPDVPVETMLRILNAERERRPGQDEVEDVMETQPPTTAPAPGISRVARAEELRGPRLRIVPLLLFIGVLLSGFLLRLRHQLQALQELRGPRVRTTLLLSFIGILQNGFILPPRPMIIERQKQALPSKKPERELEATTGQ
ncbi:MAG: hypothetical protein M1815_005100 [Lichina confinis]|nr:MAG: hypothetical protein M1815_005100 [Lichina confinis]